MVRFTIILCVVSSTKTQPKTQITKAELTAYALKFIKDNDYRNAARIIWPYYQQNEWSELIWSRIEKYDKLCIMGHGSASKTYTASIWFLLDWIAYANDTALILTSATMPSMNGRIWADFKSLWTKSRLDLNSVAQVIDSKHVIRKGIYDAKEAIHAVSADSDDSQTKIQGLHCKRNRLIIDEADNPYSNSIWKAITNLSSSGHFKGIALANPADRNSEFAFHCEPVNGWDSVNTETDFEWESKKGWHVLWLDGLRSPNILAGYDKYPYLLSNNAVMDTRDNKGVNSIEWWSFVRGFYSVDGLNNNIFTTGIVDKCKTPHIWYTTKTPIAACDPAFEGGDNCVLGLGFMGRQAENPAKTVIEINEYIRIKRKDMDKTLAFDFADQIVAILKERGVQPQYFAIDTTATQGPFADIIEEKLGKGIYRVNFAATASNRKVTAEDTGVAKERYKNFVTELWYVAREWCRLGLVYMKDPPRDLKIQLEARRYMLKGKDAKTGRDLIMAEPKTEMKARGLGSPDEGDMFCLFVHLARKHALGFTPSSFHEPTVIKKKNTFKNATVWNQTYGVSDNL